MPSPFDRFAGRCCANKGLHRVNVATFIHLNQSDIYLSARGQTALRAGAGPAETRMGFPARERSGRIIRSRKEDPVNWKHRRHHGAKARGQQP